MAPPRLTLDAPRRFLRAALAAITLFAGSVLPGPRAVAQQQQPTPTAVANQPASSPRPQRPAAASASSRTSLADPNTPPRNVKVRNDGHCLIVRPGDSIHYDLTIEGVDGMASIVGDLRLRLGRGLAKGRGDLLMPDFRSLGGGGLGARDPAEPELFHFTFTVPAEIYPGEYRGISVEAHADESGPEPQPQTGRNRLPTPLASHATSVDVTRRARNAVKAYCLEVQSNFGEDIRPAVTSFQPGPVNAPAASATGNPK